MQARLQFNVMLVAWVVAATMRTVSIKGRRKEKVMSNDKQKGRADAAQGKYNPPSSPLGGIFDTRKESSRLSERREQYREGYHDKKNEMGRKK